MNDVVFADKERYLRAKPKKIKSEEEINEMMEMWNSSSSQKEVAEAFGVSKGTVKRYFRDRREAENVVDKKDKYIEYLEDKVKRLENEVRALESR